MQELMTLYKLIILYMLARVDFPLTRIQINNFLLGREYTTNYLNIQQAMGELAMLPPTPGVGDYIDTYA